MCVWYFPSGGVIVKVCVHVVGKIVVAISGYGCGYGCFKTLTLKLYLCRHHMDWTYGWPYTGWRQANQNLCRRRKARTSIIVAGRTRRTEKMGFTPKSSIGKNTCNSIPVPIISFVKQTYLSDSKSKRCSRVFLLLSSELARFWEFPGGIFWVCENVSVGLCLLGQLDKTH